MMRPHVVVADPMHAAGIDLLQSRFEVSVFDPQRKDACRAAIESAEAVVVRTFEVRQPLLDRAPKLRAIVKHGAGVDNIDIERASELGIVVANSGDANAGSVAEASVTLMLAALRRVPEMHRVVTGGRYDERWRILLRGMHGMTLGIVGFGNIGRRVARICRAGFETRVLAYDPFLSDAQVASEGAERVADLDQLLANSDIVSIHASLASASKCLIGAAELARMKPTAIIVNTARGGVVDERALASALAEGRLYAAGLDVFEFEPPPTDNPLFALPNVVLMPHVGGATEATRRLMAERSAEAVAAILEGQRPEFGLNLDHWDRRRR